MRLGGDECVHWALAKDGGDKQEQPKTKAVCNFRDTVEAVNGRHFELHFRLLQRDFQMNFSRVSSLHFGVDQVFLGSNSYQHGQSGMMEVVLQRNLEGHRFPILDLASGLSCALRSLVEILLGVKSSLVYNSLL